VNQVDLVLLTDTSVLKPLLLFSSHHFSFKVIIIIVVHMRCVCFGAFLPVV